MSSSQTSHQAQQPKSARKIQKLCSSVLHAFKNTSIATPKIKPEATDLLLSCVRSALSKTERRRKLLPAGCPVPPQDITSSINAMPGITKVVDGLSSEQQNILDWLVSSIPYRSMEYLSPKSYPSCRESFVALEKLNIKAFIVTEQPRDKEAAFRRHSKSGAPQAVYHGTRPSRLPAILSQGLKGLSGTKLQLNGKEEGNGLYVSGNCTTAQHYAPAERAWRRSTLCNDQMSVLLGCELAGVKEKISKDFGVVPNITVVPNEDQVIVRVVFVTVRDLDMFGNWNNTKAVEKVLPEVMADLRMKAW